MTEPHDQSPPTDPDALPAMHEGVLDREKLAAYRDDLVACADNLVVRTRSTSRSLASDTTRALDDALAELLAGDTKSVQLRYVFEGVSWSDTLMRVPGAFKLVRMRMPDTIG